MTQEQQLLLALLRARCRESNADGRRVAPAPGAPQAPDPGSATQAVALQSARRPGPAPLTRCPDEPLRSLHVAPSVPIPPTRPLSPPPSLPGVASGLGDSVSPPRAAETAPSCFPSPRPSLWSLDGPSDCSLYPRPRQRGSATPAQAGGPGRRGGGGFGAGLSLHESQWDLLNGE